MRSLLVVLSLGLVLMGCSTTNKVNNSQPQQRFTCQQLSHGMIEILDETRSRIIDREFYFEKNLKSLSAYQIKNIVKGQVKDSDDYMKISYEYMNLPCVSEFMKQEAIKGYNVTKQLNTEKRNLLIRLNEL